jgi:excinuclease ABC subunit B
LYADQITGSIERAVRETDRRRKKQLAYNAEHGITPRTIFKEIKDILPVETLELELKPIGKNPNALKGLLTDKEKEMRVAAKNLDFELAAVLRDEIRELENLIKKKAHSKSFGGKSKSTTKKIKKAR